MADSNFLATKSRIVFCLGSNLGNRELFLKKACTAIVKSLSLDNIKQSSILKNKALLLQGSPKEWDLEFLNVALSGDIDLKIFPPLKILSIVKNIEKRLGKITRGRWGPREIDIDIIMIDNLKIDLGKELQIPHCELSKRDFFLKTISEIEPELLKSVINS